ncbi:hypothetical protein L6164_024197 [Bauhinia variegata]|uniref:Uncharacterized protein n=1 Tax=Bauhinia variegata TaxID=167791 RepID=A0ACB9LX29_BAUVA|nr:hypothetical protein L6164_024197 [Bauhinia variegata]
MWLPRNQGDRKDGVNGLVAVAIDKDKGSQNALKWAIDHLLMRGSTVILLHVKIKAITSSASLQIPSEHIILYYVVLMLFKPQQWFSSM